MTSKTNLFAFRCDDQIADLLEGEDNKSETIVRALREHFRREFAVTCPTCEGTGQVYNPIKTAGKDAGKSRQVQGNGNTKSSHA